jgi:S-adenosylmethionine synthetase
MTRGKNMKYPIFASESVCEGHPDKICDQISDAVLDAALTIYPKSRVAVETLVTKNKVVLAGEVTCPKKINYQKVAREVIKSLGYIKEDFGFWDKSPIEVYIHQQSPDISVGVDDGGAGDQGMMYGYAVKETSQMMPLPITLAHDLCRKMDEFKRIKGAVLRPDGKSEVTVRYENGKPAEVMTVVLANPHDPKMDKNEVQKLLYEKVVIPVLNNYKMKAPGGKNFIFNGTGKWEIGGPASDTGVTGRKIIVDTYGGMARIGGGCFSGKDPTKVDRSGAYAARFVAKNIVAMGLADRCEVQIAYAIGYKDPIARTIETFGTEKKSLKFIEKTAWKLLDLSPGGIIRELRLQRPIYRETARYGHFGNNKYPWEKVIG